VDVCHPREDVLRDHTIFYHAAGIVLYCIILYGLTVVPVVPDIVFNTYCGNIY